MSGLLLNGVAIARAHVNIALVKYWGKAPAHGPWDLNLPAVPSLSLTLDGLGSETRVAFAPDADDDQVSLDGASLTGASLDRLRPILDRVRDLAQIASPFLIESTNTVPTGAGLASSASGAAALAAGAARCAGLTLAGPELSALARLGSGSASRSVFPGWAAWEGAQARPIAGVEHWDVRLVVAIIDAGPKALSSREAMVRTSRTSPLYGGWVSSARGDFDAGIVALRDRDLVALARVMERSALRMHATAMGADPPVLYWRAASMAVVEKVRTLQQGGVPCGWTMDAGPNVKVLCESANAEQVEASLGALPGVSRTLVCRPGGGVSVDVEQSPS